MNPSYKAHDDEGIDNITIETVDRFKMSELSGDQWRYSAVIKFYRKGKLIREEQFTKLQWAVMALPYLWMTAPEESDQLLWGLNEHTCAQFGCPQEPEVVYRLKEEYSAQGDGPLPDHPWETRRAYCARHKDRGNASREDSMANYERIDAEGSDE